MLPNITRWQVIRSVIFILQAVTALPASKPCKEVDLGLSKRSSYKDLLPNVKKHCKCYFTPGFPPNFEACSKQCDKHLEDYINREVGEMLCSHIVTMAAFPVIGCCADCCCDMTMAPYDECQRLGHRRQEAHTSHESHGQYDPEISANELDMSSLHLHDVHGSSVDSYDHSEGIAARNWESEAAMAPPQHHYMSQEGHQSHQDAASGSRRRKKGSSRRSDYEKGSSSRYE